jgi:hypothetical protein
MLAAADAVDKTRNRIILFRRPAAQRRSRARSLGRRSRLSIPVRLLRPVFVLCGTK